MVPLVKEPEDLNLQSVVVKTKPVLSNPPPEMKQASLLSNLQPNKLSGRRINKKNFPALDKTPVGGTHWYFLKNHAMKPNYKHQSWYAKLTPSDKQLIEELRNAQAIATNEQLLTKPEEPLPRSKEKTCR